MTTNIISPENLVYAKPALLNDTTMHYCPGCSHGVVHKLIAEVIADMGMEEKTVGISPRWLRSVCLSLYRHRLAGNPSRACPCIGRGHQKTMARPPGIHYYEIGRALCRERV